MASTTATEIQRQQSMRKQRILIVGGGATGQVYGHHLREGGAEVSFYLKPRYAAEAEEDGYFLYPYGLVGRRPPREFRGFDVYTRADEIKHLRFDQVWLCVSSPAIRAPFIQELYAVQKEALWVSLQPGLEDRWYLLETIPKERLVTGMIGIVAYQAPLPEEDEEEFVRPGVAYWQPPLSPTLFCGPEPETTAMVNLLQAGGLTAGVRKDVQTIARYGSGALVPFVIALEAQNWSAAELRGNPGYREYLATSIEEIFSAIERDSGTTSGFLAAFTKAWVWKVALMIAPIVTPFPFDPYFRYHFSKLREQSEQMVENFLGFCRAQGVDAVVLEELQRRWMERRPQLASEVEEPREVPRLQIGGGAPAAVAFTGDVDDTDPGGLLSDPGLVADSEPTPLPGTVPNLAADSEPTPIPGALTSGANVGGTLEETTDAEAQLKPIEHAPPPDLADTQDAPSLRERLETDHDADVIPVPGPDDTESLGAVEEVTAPTGDVHDTQPTAPLPLRTEEHAPDPDLDPRSTPADRDDGATEPSQPRPERDRLEPTDFVTQETAVLDEADQATIPDEPIHAGEPNETNETNETAEADEDEDEEQTVESKPTLPKPPPRPTSSGAETRRLPDLKARLRALREKREQADTASDVETD